MSKNAYKKYLDTYKEELLDKVKQEEAFDIEEASEQLNEMHIEVPDNYFDMVEVLASNLDLFRRDFEFDTSNLNDAIRTTIECQLREDLHEYIHKLDFDELELEAKQKENSPSM